VEHLYKEESRHVIEHAPLDANAGFFSSNVWLSTCGMSGQRTRECKMNNPDNPEY